jgi:hypothetical protein
VGSPLVLCGVDKILFNGKRSFCFGCWNGQQHIANMKCFCCKDGFCFSFFSIRSIIAGESNNQLVMTAVVGSSGCHFFGLVVVET